MLYTIFQFLVSLHPGTIFPTSLFTDSSCYLYFWSCSFIRNIEDNVRFKFGGGVETFCFLFVRINKLQSLEIYAY